MLEKNLKKIRNPWAVYGWFNGAWDIGRIRKESPKGFYLEYQENKSNLVDFWDKKWVKRFKTSSNAVRYFLRHQYISGENFLLENDITRQLKKNFPKAIKQEAEQLSNNSLVGYNSASPEYKPVLLETTVSDPYLDILSQRSAKCTKYSTGNCELCKRKERPC